MRCVGVRLLISVVAVAVLSAAIAGAPNGQARAGADCHSVSLPDGSQLIDAYAGAGAYRGGAGGAPAPPPAPWRAGSQLTDPSAGAGAYPTVKKTGASAPPARVWVAVREIHSPGRGSRAPLPAGPCQHIYRYQFAKV